jgi:hypothetical protein
MAELKKIQDRIQEIARRKKNVRLSDIEWVVNHLAARGYEVRSVRNVHQVLFTVSGTKFSVCPHHKGGSQIKLCYVNEFLGAMIELGIYDND